MDKTIKTRREAEAVIDQRRPKESEAKTREKAVHRSPPNFLSDNEKLAEAEKNSADREKKARKEAANRRAIEILLTHEEHQDHITLGVARDFADDSSESKQSISAVMWDASGFHGVQYVDERRIEVLKAILEKDAKIALEEHQDRIALGRQSESDSANSQEPENGNAQSNEPKQSISDVMWDTSGLRGVKYVDGRRIEVLKPRLSNIPKSTGAIPKKHTATGAIPKKKQDGIKSS